MLVPARVKEEGLENLHSFPCFQTLNTPEQK
jgi:hypothetical protein